MNKKALNMKQTIGQQCFSGPEFFDRLSIFGKMIKWVIKYDEFGFFEREKSANETTTNFVPNC